MSKFPHAQIVYSFYLAFILLFVPIIPAAADKISPGDSGVGTLDLGGSGTIGTITAAIINSWALNVGDNKLTSKVHINTDSTGWSVSAQDSRTTPTGIMYDGTNSLQNALMIKNSAGTSYDSLGGSVTVLSGSSPIDDDRSVYLLQHVEPDDYLTTGDPEVPYSINIIYTLTY